jgi:hypothetical protein
MSLFQWIALPVLGGAFVIELVNFLCRPGERLVRLMRCLIWAAAAAAIAWPELLQPLASALGIGRAADLVFYLFVLAFLVVSCLSYASHVRLQRQITDLVRHLAIQHARKGTARNLPQDDENLPAGP